LTRLDQNRATYQVAEKAKVPVTDVKNVIIWGNHSATQYPDVSHGTINGQEIRKAINDDNWLNSAFISKVQKRGAEIIDIRKSSSGLSAANAVKDHLKDWYVGTPIGEWVSMGVVSDGNSYDIPEDLVYSFPVSIRNFDWNVVKGLRIDDFSRGKMRTTLDELLGEKRDALGDEIPADRTA